MAKAAINKKYNISANGILVIDEDKNVSIEVEETGELVNLGELLVNFADKDVKISCTYDEEY